MDSFCSQDTVYRKYCLFSLINRTGLLLPQINIQQREKKAPCYTAPSQGKISTQDIQPLSCTVTENNCIEGKRILRTCGYREKVYVSAQDPQSILQLFFSFRNLTNTNKLKGLACCTSGLCRVLCVVVVLVWVCFFLHKAPHQHQPFRITKPKKRSVILGHHYTLQ